MTTVHTGASMSLDGYIAGPGDSGFEQLFAWYGNGDVTVPTANPHMTLRLSENSAAHHRSVVEMTGRGAQAPSPSSRTASRPP